MAAAQAGRISWPSWSVESTDVAYEGYPRNISYIDNLRLDPELTLAEYHTEGTNLDSKILFLGVKVLDSTGKMPYYGDILIEGQRPNGYNTMMLASRCLGQT
jgi:hypothetical protein